MTTSVVKLSFQAPVHFGDGRLSGSEYTCDAATLFSALFIEALKMNCADELLAATKLGELTLSDAFPYIGERLYVPKPMVDSVGKNMSYAESGDSRARKANKALKYIPMDGMSDYLNGSFDFINELGCFQNGASFLRTKVNLMRETSDDAEPYHVGGFRFAPNCGVYFLVAGSYNLLPLLEQLSYSGIGGKRSSGYGRFEFSVSDNSLFPSLCHIDSGKHAMLMTSSLPREDELTEGLIDGALYHLVHKGGFVQSTSHASSPKKKRNMWLFAPGSMFERTFEGDVFDVNGGSGKHPVYRYARAMWMEV